MKERINIAIDGHSSCGKSTLAKALARKLGYTYIDSGAMYRAITYYFLTHNVHIENDDEVRGALGNIVLSYHALDDGTRELCLNGTPVEGYIRTMEVASQVSPVAALVPVRRFAVAQQQEIGRAGGIVMDGRDVGTVVYPDAGLKIFVTASLDERSRRRFLELQHKGEQISIEEVAENLSSRDHIDSTRSEGPLIQATDARVLDTTHLSPEQQLAIAYDWAKEVVG